METVNQIVCCFASILALLVIPVLVISVQDIRETRARRAALRRYQQWCRTR